MYIAFEGSRRTGAGSLIEVVTATKPAATRRRSPILIFDALTGEQVEIDFRGTLGAVLARLPTTEPELEPVRGRGRPKLGVVAREVTLLPRHWEWLNDQPNGASAALRRLVDAARKATEDVDRVRISREALYRFISVMAGDEPGFEEASRALFAGDRARFVRHTTRWPKDVRTHALAMGTIALATAPA